MKIKDKKLISYFGKNVDEEVLKSKHGYILLDLRDGSINFKEVSKIINEFPEQIQSIMIYTDDTEVIRKALTSLPQNNIGKISINTKAQEIVLNADDFENFTNLNELNIAGTNNAVIKNCQVPNNLQKLMIIGCADVQQIDCSKTEYKPNITMLALNKMCFDNLSLDIASQIDEIAFNTYDKYCETIDMGDLLEKMPNVNKIGNLPILCRKNVSNLTQITEILSKAKKADISLDLMRTYKEFYENNSEQINQDIVFGNGQAFTRSYFDEKNQKESGKYYYPGCLLKDFEDFSNFKKLSQDYEIIFDIQNMTDISFDVAKKLQQQGIKCSINIDSKDGADYQNVTYSLDEYVAISKKMNELIGDIDENLPEMEKFKQIYMRVVNYIEYDHVAGYPSNPEQKEYAEKNVVKCRNLCNGLLEGKCVCAGYADILKNACLLKGIECEYVNGPVDSLAPKVLNKQNNEHQQIVYADDKDIIKREYHAWNKVKLNGVWYNCDPTWDKNSLQKGKVPKFALLSDDVCKKMGRPTVEVLRHPCETTATLSEKNSIFNELEPCEELYVYNKIMEFESTLDEYGNPRELPIIPKVTNWLILMTKLKTIIRGTKQRFNNAMYNLKKKINIDFDKTEELPITEDTEPLDEITEPLPVINDKKNSWELTEEQLKKFNEESNIKKDTIDKNIDRSENEIGDK